MAVDWSKPIFTETWGRMEYLNRKGASPLYPRLAKDPDGIVREYADDGDYLIGDGPVGSNPRDIRNVPEPAAKQPTCQNATVEWNIQLSGGGFLAVKTWLGRPLAQIRAGLDRKTNYSALSMTPPEMRAIAEFLVEQADRMEGK